MKTQRMIMLCLLGAGILVLLGATLLDRVEMVLKPESRLWFTGTSTAYDWSCTANQIDGALAFEAEGRDRTNMAKGSVVTMAVTVPVASIDCGHPTMDRDLKQALKADAFPEVKYVLTTAEIANVSSEEGTFSIKTSGTVIAAGVGHPVELEVKGERQDDGSILFQGETPLKMSDFGIEPPNPSHLKASDSIQVSFYVIAAQQSASVTQN